YLTKILEEQGVNPIKGTKVDRRPRYFVYVKNDIDYPKLIDYRKPKARLRIKKQVQQRSEYSQHLDIRRAADFLKTIPKQISELVTNGVLIPSSSASKGKESPCFNA